MKKKSVISVTIVGIVIVLSALFAGRADNNVNITAAEGIVISAINSEINVSEADLPNTRAAAYLANIAAYDSAGRVLSFEGGNWSGYTFEKGDFTIFFEEKGEIVTVTATRNGYVHSCEFVAKVHKLRNEENENVEVEGPAFSPSFNDEGDRINDGFVEVHEQDLDENCQVIGNVQEDNIHTEDEVPNVKPSKGGSEIEVKKDFNDEQKNKAEKVTNSALKDKNSDKKTSKKENAAGGADLGNVVDISEKEASADKAQYAQISVAFADGSDTLNVVSIGEGGEGTLSLYCTKSSKGVFYCIDFTGEAVELGYSVEGGIYTFSGIAGTYR